MKCTVIINNYNYGRYLSESVESVRSQTYRDVELVIVDDGSTDGSEAMLKEYAHHENIVVVNKENGGQLSAFQAALPFVGGELVFFLDSDDWYDPMYIERAVSFYRNRTDCGFLTVERTVERTVEGGRIPADRTTKRDIGFSVLRTYYLQRWLGGVTTAISMRTELLHRILPLPDTASWRLRADDCLIMGASLAGAKKCYLPEPLVHYRLHGTNGMLGCAGDNDHAYSRAAAVARMHEYIMQKNRMVPSRKMLLPEFRSVPKKTRSDLADYMKIVILMRLPLPFAVKSMLSLLGIYAAEKLRRG